MNHRLYLAFGAAILALLGLGATSYRHVAKAAASDRWVRHTREVLETLQYLSFAMARTESSYRGYVLTGKESYIESSRANVLIAEQGEASLGRLTEDNPRQRGRVPDLEMLTAATAEFGERAINLRRAHGFEVAADAIRSGAGQQVMDKFQTLVGIMEDDERSLLALRIVDSNRQLSQTKGLLFLGTLLGVLIATGAGWTVRRDSAARDLAEAALLERTKELAVANQVLERSNIELQQFAYVASHDLQSPLRSISGFVQLISSEYQSKLDEQADDWIRRTVKAIEQMQTMIRDVLAYSRVDSPVRTDGPPRCLQRRGGAA